jgi:mxaJ protein
MKRAIVLALLALAACGSRPLKVCLDPNNLPFSNRAGQGFENRLAAILADELHRPLRTVWWAQRRGFVRNTVGEHKCDIWPGVAAGVETLATSRPYYRSSYVFVTRAEDGLERLTLDDPRLRTLRLGVQLVGDDGSNTPPAQALARRGLIGNVRGFMVYGDYARPDPPAAIVRAVVGGEIDVGLVWGPLAGYLARRSPALRLQPVTPWLDDNRWPMAFDISVGARKDDPELLRAIDAALSRRRPEIARLLADYGVPTTE